MDKIEEFKRELTKQREEISECLELKSALKKPAKKKVKIIKNFIPLEKLSEEKK